MDRLYKYTLDCSNLSKEQRDFYEDNGYLVVKQLVGEDQLKSYHDRFVDICHGRVDIGRQMLIMRDVSLCKRENLDPEKTVNRIQDFQVDPVLSEYFKLPDLLNHVESFTGPDIAAVNFMVINKPPGTDASRQPLHQDLHYFPFRPADRIVCSWTAMEKATRKNGCLEVIPGTHKGKLLKHIYPECDGVVNSMYHGIQNQRKEKELVYLEMDAGDTVFFHPLLVHGSGTNQTNGYRKAISCHFSTCHSHNIDVEGTTQENIKNEVMKLAKRKYPGLDFTFNDTFDLRRVVVKCGKSKL